MLDSFLKKSSKFLAVLLTVVLVFTQLGYATTSTTNVSDYHSLYLAINSESVAVEQATINLLKDIDADGTLGTQATNIDKMILDGNGYILHGNENFGLQTGNETVVKDVIFSSFSSVNGGAINNTNSLTVDAVIFSSNTASEKGGAIYNPTGTVDFNGLATFTGNKANGEANDIYNGYHLNFNEGSIVKMDGGIIGGGTTTIKGGSLELEIGAKLEQYVSVDSGTLKIGAQNTKETLDNKLSNNGNLIIVSTGTGADGVDYLGTNVVGTGTTTIHGQAPDNNLSYIKLKKSLNMEQSKLIIDDNSLLNVEDLDSLTITDVIENNGHFSLTEGTIETNIIGIGTTSITQTMDGPNVVYNNATISQASVEVGGFGRFRTRADTITTTDKILSHRNLEFGLFGTDTNVTDTNNNLITGKGFLTITGSGDATNGINEYDLTNNNNITQYSMAIEYATLTNNEDNVITVEEMYVGNSEKYGNIVNKGTIAVTTDAFYTYVGSTITNEDTGVIVSSHTLYNGGGATLKSNASGMQTKIDNMGTYEITGGTVSFAITSNTGNGIINMHESEVTVDNTIGYNNIDLSTTLNLANESNIVTSTLTICNGAKLNTVNDSTGTVLSKALVIADYANWNYELDVDLETATADTLINLLVGTGSQATISNLNFLTDATQDQVLIEIADASINAIVVPDLYTTTTNYKVQAVNDEGVTKLLISADKYGGLPNAIHDGASLYSVTKDIDYATEWIEDPTGVINNTLKADLTINGNNKVLTTTTSISGINVSTQTLKISNLTEFSGFTTHYLDVEDGGTLNVSSVTFKNADDVVDIIRNEGMTILSDVTFADNNASDIIANTNSGTIVLSSVTFMNNIAELDIENNGKMVLTGYSSTFVSGIRGDGLTVIDGVDIDMGDAMLAQNEVDVNRDSSLTVKIGKLSTPDFSTGFIFNNGELFLAGGETDAVELYADIDGVGDTELSNKVDVVSSITQNKVTIKELAEVEIVDGIIRTGEVFVEDTAKLTTDADSIDTYSKNGQISNEGVVDFTGGTNTNKIAGTGELLISGDVENEAGIFQSTVTITGTLVTNASAISTSEQIVNGGTLNFVGDGVNNSTITALDSGNGSRINIYGNLVNIATSIEQSTISVNEGMLVNERGSKLYVTDFMLEEGTNVYTDAADLLADTATLASGSTLNMLDDEDAVFETNITGAGSIEKSGTGVVDLVGTNNYTGTTTISEGGLRISTSTNIGENRVVMNGGKLIVEDSFDEVVLANEITATEGNNINIEANSNVVLINVVNQASTQRANFIKTGDAWLAFADSKYSEIFADNLVDGHMEENFYNGDTIVDEGYLFGTTQNINGKLFGSKADKTNGVVFYDHDSDVVLNEIDSEDYIGYFKKVGNSTMTVINNFHSVNADIIEGTFVINNDSEMNGSRSDFIVDNKMYITDAVLKGYGDIKVGELLIKEGATFAPGCSTTTFKVDGDLTFEASGNYDVEFSQLDMDKANEEQTNDKTVVTGLTKIDSDAKITLNNLEGKYYVHETMNLIESGSINGGEYKLENVKFNDNDATDLRAGYKTRISTRVYVDGNALKIDLERKASDYGNAVEFERSHNEQEAANAIDAISTGNGGDITLALDTLEKFYYYESTYDIDSLKSALNDVAGVIYANSAMLTFTNAKIEHVYDKIQKRSIDLFPCTKFHDKIWAEYYYNNYNVDESKESPKFDTSVNGFLVGFDMISANNWTVGAMAGYGTSELKQKSDKTNMNDINLGFYGGYETDKWLFKGMLLGGYEQYSTDRSIKFMDRNATSEHNGYSAALDLEAGYKIALNSSTSTHKLTLKPFVGVTGSYVAQEGFEEKGAQDLNLKVEDYNNLSAQARLGVGINGKVKKFSWYAKAGVRQMLTEDYAEIESSLLNFKDDTKMTIRSAELDKFSYGGGIGADYALSDAWTIFANGLASFADKSNNYYGNIGLMYKFGCINNVAKTDDVDQVRAMLDEKIAQEEAMKKELQDLKDRIQKYEANIVSAEKAQQMKEKTIKKMRLEEKPTFIFGTDQLTGKGKESLRQVARELEKYPDSELLVEGHTDSVGSDEINQNISENRAASVATTLKKDYNVKNSISVIGKGKTEPIASNDTEEGRATNRRVEIIVTTAE